MGASALSHQGMCYECDLTRSWLNSPTRVLAQDRMPSVWQKTYEPFEEPDPFKRSNYAFASILHCMMPCWCPRPRRKWRQIKTAESGSASGMNKKFEYALRDWSENRYLPTWVDKDSSSDELAELWNGVSGSDSSQSEKEGLLRNKLPGGRKKSHTHTSKKGRVDDDKKMVV